MGLVLGVAGEVVLEVALGLGEDLGRVKGLLALFAGLGFGIGFGLGFGLGSIGFRGGGFEGFVRGDTLHGLACSVGGHVLVVHSPHPG